MFAFAAVVDAGTKRPVPDAYGAAIYQALARCAESTSTAPPGCPQVEYDYRHDRVHWSLLGKPLDGAVYHDAIFGPGWVEGVAIFVSSDLGPWPRLSAHPTGYVADILSPAGNVRLQASWPSRDVVKPRPALSVGAIEDSVTSKLLAHSPERATELGLVWTEFDRMTGIFTVRGSYRYNAEDLDGRRCRMFFAEQIMVVNGDPRRVESNEKRYCRGPNEPPVIRR
jgi:hypothetical protein